MTVADMKKMLDAMPSDAKIIINVNKVDANWIVTDSGVMTSKDGDKVAWLHCDKYDNSIGNDD